MMKSKFENLFLTNEINGEEEESKDAVKEA